MLAKTLLVCLLAAGRGCEHSKHNPHCGDSGSVVVTPEPGTFGLALLVGLGVALVGLCWRRK